MGVESSECQARLLFPHVYNILARSLRLAVTSVIVHARQCFSLISNRYNEPVQTAEELFDVDQESTTRCRLLSSWCILDV